jgi:uncharacterized membrane protein YkoI
MKIKYGIIFLLVLGVIFASGCTDTSDLEEEPGIIEQPENEISEQEQTWIDTFDLDECNFLSTGENEYFILKPGYQLILEGYDEDSNSVELVITVLNTTRTIDGVDTRVMEEKESVNGVVEEISWNFFAFCEQTKDIYYFGEEVDIYDEGEVVSHDGAWIAGSEDARAGIMMPGTIQIGYRYYQEVAPDIAMDRAEILSDEETLQTPAGTFTTVLKVEESTPLEPGATEYKFHAPGIGLIKDEELLLTQYSFIDMANFTAYITQQYAEEIASGVASGTVTGVLTEEWGDRLVYVVKMVDGSVATDVTIDALTGAIVTTETSEYTEEPVDTGEQITEEQAKEIALGAVPGTVTGVAMETKGGKLVYVVEIKSNYGETDVIIDIVTGEILGIET